jgi:GNAT superfamily N-acetyltransferase
MVATLDHQPLKSGESLEVGLVTAPDAELAPRIGSLLAHKGPEWQFHMESALRGETGSLQTRYYLGLLSGEPVANVMTVESGGVGILGHVFTQPEHRRKGICRAIMGRVMEDFRGRGGQVLLLGTGYESAPYWIYHAFGFRSLKGGFMRYAADPAGTFERDWFAPAPVRAQPLEWRHWPLLALLGAQSEGERLRSAAWRLFGIGNLETPVVRSLEARAAGRGVDGVVRESERGAVVGCATLHPTGSGINGWPGVWLLDLFTHPSYNASCTDLLDAIALPAGKILCYVSVDAAHKAEVLEAAGFEREGLLRDFLRAEGGCSDVWLFGRSVGSGRE